MDSWATPFFSFKNRLFCSSLVNRVKDLVNSNSIVKLSRCFTLCQCIFVRFLICINSRVKPAFCNLYPLFVKCNRPTVT